MDGKEAKKQILFAIPIILTNIFYNLIPTVSIMFTGHLGELELASSTLAQSWATVTGYSFMIGLSGALETLCGQGFGAKMYNMLGIYLQASCIVSFLFSIAISLLWWYTEPILISLQQNPEIAKQSGMYMRLLIPGIFAYGILQNILRFFQTQSVVAPIVLLSLMPLLIHIAFTNLLVHHTSLGFKGAALATSLTFWFSVLILMLYVSFAKTFRRTWTGLSFTTFSFVFTNFNLALYSASMLCLEYWAFEILVILAGIMPNSEETTSLVAMCVYTEAIAFMVTYGMSAAASTRVSNELGEGNTKEAKHAMNVSLKLSVLLASIVVIGLAFGRHIWPSLFSNIPSIIKAFASMTPLLCCSIFLDAIQGVLSGACRGCGWQQLATYINLATFYLIGMPIACLLAFKLQYGVKGLWFGLVCGLLTQSFLLYMITLLKDWTVIATPHDYSDSDLDKNEEEYKPGLT